jgi:DNA ligase-1
MNDFYKRSLKEGNEGIMIKSLDSKYIPGRRVGGWVKLKPIKETLDLVITEADWGEGKRANWLASFTLACRDKNELLPIGKVGTGISEKDAEITFDFLTKELKPLIKEESGKHVILKPKIILEIGYEEIQKSPTYKSGYALRFPKVVNLRKDLGFTDIDDLTRVEKIFRTQHKIK